MPNTFVIAEAACTWLHAGLEGAFRSIQAAKDCGADAWKTQWTSDPEAMAMRRGVAKDKYKRLGWSGDALPQLKAECDRVGIEFMCTVFIPKDVALIAPYVKRFKISAFEGRDASPHGMIDAHIQYVNDGKPLIISIREGEEPVFKSDEMFKTLHVVSEYPTTLERLHLRCLKNREVPGLEQYLWAEPDLDGLSDHTTSVLTGAVAVGAGAKIIEKHVRLSDTPQDDPDYGHSLSVDASPSWPNHFAQYVRNIREAEMML